jgi:FkbM family methyltransferase
MSATWDNFTYFTNDTAFLQSISYGKSEPYDGGYNSQLNIVKRFVSKYPERSRVMIDVGAHIGTTMLPYSRIFKSVYGFEPNRESYDFCVINIEYNSVKNCYVENCAIMNKKIKGKSVQHNNCNTGCFYFVEDENDNGVATKILDEDERLTEVDFIKIDTEGAELSVISSALNIIKKWKPLIQAEINGLSEKNFNIPKENLIETLTNLGYVNISNTDFFYHKDYVF